MGGLTRPGPFSAPARRLLLLAVVFTCLFFMCCLLCYCCCSVGERRGRALALLHGGIHRDAAAPLLSSPSPCAPLRFAEGLSPFHLLLESLPTHPRTHTCQAKITLKKPRFASQRCAAHRGRDMI